MAEDLTIQELAPMGDGVHVSARGRIYVDRALPGERVRAKVHKAGGLLRGDLVEVLEAAPNRIAAPCPNYDLCGGCTVQHMDEASYRAWKVAVVRTALDRQGLEPETWRDPVFLPPGQRRRVTFAALKRGKSVTLGYCRRRTHHVTSIATCLTAEPAIMDLRAKLATLLAPVLQDDKAADVFIQTVAGQVDVVITGPIGRKGFPDLQVHEALADMAHQAGISRISWRPKDRGEPEVMVERNPVFARFGELDVALPPLAFLQPTKAGEDALANAILAMLPKKGKFADLFCGCGTFSGPLLTRGTVDAFDNVEPALRALDKAKGGKPLKAVRRDLFDAPLQPDETGAYDALVFDPPRIGAEPVARALADGAVPRVIGVSCNPSTFARDARILVDGGYRLESVQVIDQFTWSHHVELAASFVR